MKSKSTRNLKVVVVMKMMALTLIFPGYTQTLKTGQKLPDSVFKNVFNYTATELKYSDFEAKLIIFDFWDPSCSSCLASFPKLDSLQNLFKEKIQIIMVNKQSLDSTRNYFKRRKFLVKPAVPFITSSIYLNKMFSVVGMPALVWLDGDGKYYGMTNKITSDAISRFLEDQTISEERYFGQRNYLSDLFDPLYQKSVQYYSYLSHSIPGVNLIGSKTENAGLTLTNVPILNLYFKAYDPDEKYKFYRPGRTIIESKETVKFIFPKDDGKRKEWTDKYLFNYALMLPKETEGRKFKIMQDDLFRYFNIDAQITRRLVKALVLIRTNKVDRLKTKGKDAPRTFLIDDFQTGINTEDRYFYNQPYTLFSDLLCAWVENKFSRPFVDQTNYYGLIDVKFKGEVLDNLTLSNLRKELGKYNLDLVEKEISLDVLVLKN